jgi:hypothetical protein
MNRLALVRGSYGALLLAAPDLAVSLLSGQPSSPKAALVVRVLGARQVLQAAATAGTPTALVWTLGAGVDVTHGLSAVGLAVVQPPWRRAGLSVASIAGLFAVSGMVRASRARAH